MFKLQILALSLLISINSLQAGDKTPSQRPQTPPAELDDSPIAIRAMIAAINRMALTASAKPNSTDTSSTLVTPIARRPEITYTNSQDPDTDLPMLPINRSTNPEERMSLFDAAATVDSKTDLSDTFDSYFKAHTASPIGYFGDNSFDPMFAFNLLNQLRQNTTTTDSLSAPVDTRSRANSGEYETPPRPTATRRPRSASTSETSTDSSAESSPEAHTRTLAVRRRISTQVS